MRQDGHLSTGRRNGPYNATPENRACGHEDGATKFALHTMRVLSAPSSQVA